MTIRPEPQEPTVNPSRPPLSMRLASLTAVLIGRARYYARTYLRL